ncbi:hypothetical protein VSR17_20880 [Cupriavidus taiwanensis]|uniref:hypothetical protein n=1 Tax=Cupriavidus taiwanensis TaxID=164546 RepID=UPI0011C06700|nr:hypothetical protein [Cupriavidus taiwanensis]
MTPSLAEIRPMQRADVVALPLRNIDGIQPPSTIFPTWTMTSCLDQQKPQGRQPAEKAKKQGIKNKKAVPLDGFGLLWTVFWRREGPPNQTPVQSEKNLNNLNNQHVMETYAPLSSS